MTTKRDREASLRIRSMDEATLDRERAALAAIAREGTPNAPETMQAKGKLSANAAERRRRLIPPRGDESWVVGKWLEDERIPQADGIPDEWKPHQKPNAVAALLRREFGEDGFNRFFGYDSPRWDREFPRRVGMAGSRAPLRQEIAAREFRDFAVGWARDVRTIQEAKGVGVWTAVRRLAESLAVAWLKTAKDTHHARDRSLNNARHVLSPGTEAHKEFMNRLKRALYDVVKPHLEARDRFDHPLIRARRPRNAARDAQIAKLADAVEDALRRG